MELLLYFSFFADNNFKGRYLVLFLLLGFSFFISVDIAGILIIKLSKDCASFKLLYEHDL